MKRLTVEALVAAAAVSMLAIALYFFAADRALAGAEQQWDASGIDSYRMVVSRVNGWNGQRWLVEVDGASVRGGFLTDEGELLPVDEPPTIDNIYHSARRWLAEHRSLLMRSSVDLQVDDDGVPARIHMRGLVAEDAEVTWTIENFEAK